MHNVKGSKSVDLLYNRYNTVQLDKVWFVDFSFIGEFWLLVVQEAASKCIIAFDVKESKGSKKKCSFTAEDCVTLIANALTFNKEPEIIHSDRGGQFKTKTYVDYLHKNGIKQSIVDTEKLNFGNQVIERLFRTIKALLIKENPSYEQITKKEEMNKLIELVVEKYYDTTHKSLIGLSPHQMQEALLDHTVENNMESPETALVPVGLDSIERTYSEKSNEVEEIKATVVRNYAGNWLTFFLEWRRTMTAELKQEMREQSDRVIETLKREQQIQYESYMEAQKALLACIKELESKLTEMERRALEAEAFIKQKEEMRRRRKERHRLPSRDMAGLSELKLAIEVANSQEGGTSYTKARSIVCLCILYLTGLRVSNLLKLQVRHIKQLLIDHKFDLDLIKTRKTIIQTFYVPSTAYSFFGEVKVYFTTLIKDKGETAFVLTEEHSSKLLDRSYLTRRLNNILKEVSKKVHKNISTHSFRINLTTTLIETVGLEAACKAIGYADIKTTAMYNRRHFSANEITRAFNKAHEHVLQVNKTRERRREAKLRKRTQDKLLKLNK